MASSNAYTSGGRVRLNLEGLGIVRARLKGAIDMALIQTAIEVRDEAKKRAVKDTGFLAESIHIVTAVGSEYSAARATSEQLHAAAVAAGRTPKGVKIGPKSRYNFFPEIRPENPNEVWVVVGAVHGISNEESTAGRKPFLKPALYQHRSTLTKQIKTAFNGLSVRAVISKSRV